MRRVEHAHALAAEGTAQHFRCERGAAHPEQDDVVHLPLHRVREREQEGDVVTAPRGLVQPAEPPRLVLRGPDRRIARPDPLDELAALGGHC